MQTGQRAERFPTSRVAASSCELVVAKLRKFAISDCKSAIRLEPKCVTKFRKFAKQSANLRKISQIRDFAYLRKIFAYLRSFGETSVSQNFANLRKKNPQICEKT